MKPHILLLCASLFVTTDAYAVSTPIIAGAGAAGAANYHNHMVNEQSMRLATTAQHSNVIGVMSCSAPYRSIPGTAAYDMEGCKVKDERLSIEEFFRRNRKHYNYEIISVIYNDHSGIFIIYYGIANK